MTEDDKLGLGTGLFSTLSGDLEAGAGTLGKAMCQMPGVKKALTSFPKNFSELVLSRAFSLPVSTWEGKDADEEIMDVADICSLTACVACPDPASLTQIFLAIANASPDRHERVRLLFVFANLLAVCSLAGVKTGWALGSENEKLRLVEEPSEN